MKKLEKVEIEEIQEEEAQKYPLTQLKDLKTINGIKRRLQINVMKCEAKAEKNKKDWGYIKNYETVNKMMIQLAGFVEGDMKPVLDELKKKVNDFADTVSEQKRYIKELEEKLKEEKAKNGTVQK